VIFPEKRDNFPDLQVKERLLYKKEKPFKKELIRGTIMGEVVFY
jgi:hypothetical protein